MTEVFLNGKFVGEVENASDFVEKVRSERRRGSLSHMVNVHVDSRLDRIIVNSGRGRAQRPLIIVKDGQSLLTEKHVKQLQRDELSWSDLIKQGVVEYLDAGEEENCLVAFSSDDITSEHTHLEISPLSMLGLVTSLIPFANYMLPVRLIIGSKNQRQSIGLYAANYPVRLDMDMNILHYPQRPVVKTAMHDISKYDSYPAGQNIVVAVLSYRGYNMEDAVIINRGSIERGMGRSTYFRIAEAEELRYSGGLTDEVSVPDKDVKGFKSDKDYRFLDSDGIVQVESKVSEEDVVIGKTSPPRFLTGMDDYTFATNVRRESSVSLKHGETGVVDFVSLTESEDGNKLVQVRLRDNRIPEVGDKFISRHGQKGVVGVIVPEADMPFTVSGVVPDLLFNPHGIPSRMTISHLLELLGGKVGALSGRYVDGTVFDAEPEMVMREELKSLGFSDDGSEFMVNGVTGERFEARIFVGSMYYLKLKHLVANRLQSRARGPIQLLTRQPTEGRAKEGGLRLGEMEKDTLVAHGASLLLKERFDSDRTVVPVCEQCGMIAIHDGVKGKRYCAVCGDNVEVSDIEISYAFKLILDEFKSLGINLRLKLKNKF